MPVRIFGHIPGIPIGTVFPSREALRNAGVHSQNMAGISGSRPEGADAIVISGGYEDDEDWGSEINYTGQGGRDPETGKQVEDQTLTRGPGAGDYPKQGAAPEGHSASARGIPLRWSLSVADAWHEKGKSGKRVWRYRLRALETEATSKGTGSHIQLPLNDTGAPGTPPKKAWTVTRLIRDTKKSRELKERYDYTCQVCTTRLEGIGGPYAEAAHIRPLGAPHNGSDTYDNLIRVGRIGLLCSRISKLWAAPS